MNNQWSTLLPPAPVGPPHQCKPERVLSFHTVESSTSSSPFHKIYQLSSREICAKSEALRPRRWGAFLTGWLLRGFATVRFSVRFNGDLFLFSRAQASTFLRIHFSFCFLPFLSPFLSLLQQLLFTSHFSVYWDSLTAQFVKNLPAMQETPVQFQGQEDLLEKE